MTIPDGHKKNLETIIRAAKNGDLALMECTRKADNMPCVVICTIELEGKEYVFKPFAEMFSAESPFDQWNPPQGK